MIYKRDIDDESLLWSPRTGGCLVMKNAAAFLDVILRLWPNEEECVSEIAANVGQKFEGVFNDVKWMIGLLAKEGFLSRDSIGEPGKIGGVENGRRESTAFDYNGNQRDGSWTPLGDFFMRHRLPCELHIDLTDRCNERCVHCYIPRGEGKLIDERIFRKATTEFREAQGLTVFVSGGECMLHPRFFEFLKFAKELNLNIVVMSNLTMCDADAVRQLAESDPQFVNVSLYSMDAAVHDAITQVKGSWRKTMDAILALEQAGVHVRIATPVMHENRDSIPALLEFSLQHHMHLIPDCDIFGRIDHDCSNQSHGLSAEEMKAVLSAHPGVFYKPPTDGEKCGLDCKVCDVGDAKLNLSAYGEYYPCDGFHGMLLGNASEMTLTDVWHGEKLNSLRALKNRDFGECAGCEDRAWCKVCPMRNFNETGDMFVHAPERCVATKIRRCVFGG